MAASNNEWEEFPSYYDLAGGIQEFVVKTYRETFIETKDPRPIEASWRYYNFSPEDISLVIVFSIIWTILRHLTTENIFKPFASNYALTPTNERKMPESAWKFVYYLSAWSYTFYVLILCGRYRFFQQPSTVWQDWSLDAEPPWDIYLVYLSQCGFYLHSLYATVVLDTWRKDSFVMMIHHVLTLVLIAFSFSLRYHNIGIIVLFTHDVCDIFLEFTKLNVYFKTQGNQLVERHEWMANFSFLCFTVAWFVFRLYLYPLRVLHTTTWVVEREHLVLPGALLMNSLLWILQLLNIYWFLFIVQFLYRVATGQVQEVDDTREYDVEEKFRKASRSTENGIANGAKMNGNCAEEPLANGAVSSRRPKED